MRRLFFALVPLVLAADAGAQIIRPGMRFREPATWASFGAALLSPFDVRTGATDRWQFGDGIQYAASVEKVLSGGATLGVRGTHARVPLFYAGNVSTDADANVSQVFGVLHVASGREFHSVLELSVGATIFSNFRSRTTDQRLEPTSPDSDFSFGFGYGFGYNFSPTFGIDIVQDVSAALHQKTGLTASESSTIRMNSTRLIARFGLGSR